MEKDYYVGIDSGTNSNGWAATDSNYNLIRVKGKNLWGTRLFEEAQTAAKRRIFRSSRRRLQRKKQRIKMLQSFFAQEISKIDMGFFQRLKESKYLPVDKNGEYNALFSDANYTDKDFYKQFPTIYHLREKLCKDATTKYDIRLIYLAIQHIYKHRGHFLFEGSSFEDFSSFSNALINYKETIIELFFDEINFDISNKAKIEEVLKSKATKTDKKRQLYFLFNANSSHEKAFIDLLIGSKIKLSKIFDDESYDESDIKDIEFSKAGFDDIAASLENSIGVNNFKLILCAKAIYDLIILSGILGEKKSISEAKIEKYNKHKNDLKLLKEIVKEHFFEHYQEIFSLVTDKVANYPAYI
ncbi:MAG: type II CRISPR RNA-guided endonuclease Cas9, partial [Treponemataceae bacterium]